MSNRSIIPFGPQHPVLPEPIHLDLVLEDEKVVEAIPTIGFVHRGLEKLVEKKDFQDYVFVAERICGICSFMHGMGYSQAVEKLMDIKIPGQDGLELAKELLQQDPDLKVIIVSSFQDFSYAQKALKLGVSSYLSKPIRPVELNKGLEKVREEILEKQEAYRRKFASEQILKQNMDLLRHLHLNQLFHKKQTLKEEEIYQQFKLLEIEMTGCQFAVLVFKLRSENINAQPALLKNYVEAKFQEQGYHAYGYFEADIFHCLLNCNNLTIELLEQLAWQMVDEVRRQFREIPGILDGTAKPDYKTCISISSKGAIGK